MFGFLVGWGVFWLVFWSAITALAMISSSSKGEDVGAAGLVGILVSMAWLLACWAGHAVSC